MWLSGLQCLYLGGCLILLTCFHVGKDCSECVTGFVFISVQGQLCLAHFSQCLVRSGSEPRSPVAPPPPIIPTNRPIQAPEQHLIGSEGAVGVAILYGVVCTLFSEVCMPLWGLCSHLSQEQQLTEE